MALCAQGRVAIFAGRVRQGLALLDEAMVEAGARELSAVILGQVYCTAIEGCQQIADFPRVERWTALLAGWCAAQPGLVTFTGQCSLHRGQVLRERGAWDDALEEFTAAIERYRRSGAIDAVGQVAAERGDLLRLRGDLAAADDSYRLAAEHGYDPQPGLALLWCGRGELDPALAAARRVRAECRTDVDRARVLPGVVQVLLAGADVVEAGAAAADLERIATEFGTELVLVRAAICSGLVQIAVGDPAGALPYLRKARAMCARLQLPYSAGLAALATARALVAMGDTSSAARGAASVPAGRRGPR